MRAVCALGICSDQGADVVEGAVDGMLSLHPRGNAGFGWDAIFVPKGEGRTFGEMSPAEKDARSHRRQAWQLLRERL
jgi:XTP/dITP diphosphohydrolase